MNKLSDFSKDELVAILEIIEGACMCDSADKMKALLLRTKDLVEADYAACGIGELEGFGLGDRITVINGNNPKEWIDMYVAGKMHRSDPMVKYHARCSMAQVWSEILKGPLDTESMRTAELAMSFGIRHGVSNGVYVPEENKLGIFAFSSPQDRFRDHHKKLIDVVSLHLNRALLDITKSHKESVSGHIDSTIPLRL